MTLLIDLSGVDWALLRAQKRWLIDQLQRTEEAEGLIGLIDSIQDQAVDVCARSSDLVFGVPESD